MGNTGAKNGEQLKERKVKMASGRQKKKCSPSGEQRGIQYNLGNKKSGNKVVSEAEVENLFELAESAMGAFYSL